MPSSPHLTLTGLAPPQPWAGQLSRRDNGRSSGTGIRLAIAVTPSIEFSNPISVTFGGKQRNRMNWKRIAFFVVVGFITTAAAATAFGVLATFLRARGIYLRQLTEFGQAASVLVALVAVFAVFAYMQSTRTLANVSACGVAMWLLSFIPNVLIYGQPPVAWASSLLLVVAVMNVGLLIGVIVRRKRGGHRKTGESPETNRVIRS